MEDPLQIVPVTALVSLAHVSPVDTLAKKFWHIICKAQYILPCGLQIIKVTLFLVRFECRMFMNIALEVLNTLPSSQDDIGFPSFAALPEKEEDRCLMLTHGAIPLSYASFELPSCARCFLGYSCNSHKSSSQ